LPKFLNYGQKCFKTLAPYDKEDKNALKPFHIFKQKMQINKAAVKVVGEIICVAAGSESLLKGKDQYG
jgi:hypothetical protein